jgi:hypothetical protein
VQLSARALEIPIGDLVQFSLNSRPHRSKE